MDVTYFYVRLRRGMRGDTFHSEKSSRKPRGGGGGSRAQFKCAKQWAQKSAGGALRGRVPVSSKRGTGTNAEGSRFQFPLGEGCGT
jgi:hypothetical protein